MNSSIKIDTDFQWAEITIGNLPEISIGSENVQVVETVQDISPPAPAKNNETAHKTVSREENSAIPTPIPAKDPVLEAEAISKITEKLQTFYKGIIKTGFKPLDFLFADLFGGFRPSQTIELFSDKSLSDREQAVLLQLLDELSTHCKYSPCSKETFELVMPYLMKTNQTQALAQIINTSKLEFEKDFRVLFDLTGVISFPDEKIDQNTDSLLYIPYLYKHSQITEFQEKLLYDSVIARETPQLAGLPYFIYKNNKDVTRPLQPLLVLIKKRFKALNKKEKERFVNDYKHEKEFLSLYFLLKDVYPREIIKKWLIKQKTKYGKTAEAGVAPGMSLLEKVDVLKEKKLLYTIPAFSLLMLLNSEKKDDVKRDILAAYEENPDSYLVNSAMAVLALHYKNYEEFFSCYEKSGRLKYRPENIYFKSIALMESDRAEEAEQLIEALHSQFPDSIALVNALSHFRMQ